MIDTAYEHLRAAKVARVDKRAPHPTNFRNNSTPRPLNGSNEVDVRLAISTFRSKQRDSKAIAMLQLSTMYLND